MDEEARANLREYLIGLIDKALASDHLVIDTPVEIGGTPTEREVGPLHQLCLAWWEE